MVRQSITSLNSSIFIGGNDIPANLFCSEAPQALQDQQEREAPKTQRKIKDEDASFINDVSPIAHNIESSDYKNTKFTNILDYSAARSEVISQNDINIEILASESESRVKPGNRKLFPEEDDEEFK